MRLGTKSDLIGCLEDLVPPQVNVAAAAASPEVKVIILDGAAIINMLPPGRANTFDEYASQVVLPNITSQLKHIHPSVLSGMNTADSLKADTRQKRGRCISQRVEPSSSIPGNWQGFLCTDENKM